MSDADVDAVLRRAFGEPVRDEDRQRFFDLPLDRRRQAVQRLSAVLDSETARTAADIDQIAEKAGLKRGSLFRLRKRWRSEDRSLDVVIPWASRASPTVATQDTTDVSDQIRRLLMQDSTLSNGDIARAMRNELGSSLALSTLVKLAQLQRRQTMHDQEALAPAYGSALIIDACNVDILIEVDQKWVVPACCFAVERSSGLILAAVTTHPEQAAAAQFAAMEEAEDLLAEQRLDRKFADRRLSAVRLTLPPLQPDDGSPAELERRLREELDIEISGASKRRFGERLRSSLGSNIGKLRLLGHWHVDEPPTMTRRKGRVLSWSQADKFVAAEVKQHNEVVFEVLEKAGLHREFGNKAGAMSASLRTIRSAWPYSR